MENYHKNHQFKSIKNYLELVKYQINANRFSSDRILSSLDITKDETLKLFY